MIYLTGVINEHVNTLKAALGLDVMLGMIVQPATACYGRHAIHYDWIGLDNGCFSEAGRARFTIPSYLKLIDRLQEDTAYNLLWATAPDVVGDWEATLASSLPVLETIREHAPVALVTQDGATPETVPWSQIDAIFVGGSTDWKFGTDSRRIMKEARRKNKWTHVGRVNSLKRMRMAERCGTDSCDGTYLSYTDPIRGLADLVNWLYEINGPDPWRMGPENLKDWACRLYGDDPSNERYDWYHSQAVGEI